MQANQAKACNLGRRDLTRTGQEHPEAYESDDAHEESVSAPEPAAVIPDSEIPF